MSVMFVGAIMALVVLVTALGGSRLSLRVGDWDVQHGGSGAACHLAFLLREIEMGFG